MDKDYNTILDELSYEEQRKHRQIGFSKGYRLGEETGWKDGFVYGVRRGAQIAAEIGFYQGFVHAWIEILEKEDEAKNRKLVALRTLLEMTRQFPKNNLEQQDTVQRLARIRAKFKQVNSLLKCDYLFNSSINTSVESNEDYDQTSNINNSCNWNQANSSTFKLFNKRSPTPNTNYSSNEMSF